MDRRHAEELGIIYLVGRDGKGGGERERENWSRERGGGRGGEAIVTFSEEGWSRQSTI